MTHQHGGSAPLRISMIGTRGVPAAYGGFETAVEEIGRRLIERGHHVTVYCRTTRLPRRARHLGMDLVHLPAVRTKVAETLSHSALSVLHAVTHTRPDAAFVFNAANAPLVPGLRMRGIPTAVHVDGLEWKRAKWGGGARRYYRFAEQFAVRHADALIADADGIADYYRDEFGVSTTLLTYGAPVLTNVPSNRLAELGLTPNGYHLVVARFEPENHVDLILRGYRESSAALPLVVVGSAPYAAAHTDTIASIAASDPRIRLLGGIWDQELLDQLYVHAAAYLHGHSVGGTNPSLLRAMGAGTPVVAFDVTFNREVLGVDGAYFDEPASVAQHLHTAEAHGFGADIGQRLQDSVRQRYNWDVVAAGYESLAFRLAEGYSSRGTGHARRSPSIAPSRPVPVTHPLVRPHPAPKSN